MILVLDFGSQTSQLIARKVRGLGVYSQIIPFSTPIDEIRKLNPTGIIFSGGPASVSDDGSPRIDPAVLELGVPILGICYGMQLMVHMLGGEVRGQNSSEYGPAILHPRKSDEPLLDGIADNSKVWMSHNDAAVRLPDEWLTLAGTDSCEQAMVRHTSRPLMGVQFHPEVHHSVCGPQLLKNFVFHVCKAAADWKLEDFIEKTCDDIRALLAGHPGSRIVCATSGGVDSTVLATLLHKAAGDRFLPVFVDNGVLRMDEAESVRKNFREKLGIELTFADASDHFLDLLQGVTEPENKRRIIGREFVNVFLKELSEKDFLAQGTLYPDVIESVNVKGPSSKIKTHHNRVPEILALMEQGRVVEPLKELFKDEVRELGAKLGIPHEMLWRQPFPGPGLAVRILGEVTRKRLDILRQADKIIVEEIKAAGLYEKCWQSFGVLLPVKAVGVMGDARTYADVIAVRAVESVDAMTADFAHLPWEVLGKISSRIINEVRGVNRVVYDVSSKPPATIEWE
ncbi:glutamine-hydrolyzing GMP synthase [Candidatus Sumerlaeota bacterium]|nr:glutamine-hydrolyzing GMP synthase [Candidatus Sumerlaeota bacterium]